MTAIAPGLTVRDSQILELLRGGATPQRVADIGRYRRSWSTDDVDRVVRQHITREEAAHTVWRPQPYAGTSRDVHLTARQADVLAALCAGDSNSDIGVALGLAEDTVKSHVRAVIAALGADDRLHAAVLALTGRVRVLIPNQHRRTT